MKFSTPFNNKPATPPVADSPPIEAQAPPPAPPKRVPWTAVAARPHNGAKGNQGEAYLAARRIKEGHSTRESSTPPKSVQREVSTASLGQKDFTSNISLSTFPTVPQIGVEASTINDKLRNLQRKMSFTRDDTSSGKIDLGLTSAENQRLTGLPLQQSRSMADIPTLNRAASDRSLRSLKVSNTSGNSLGEKVGFTFKTTTGFVHPNQKTPSRFTTPLTQSETNSQHTSGAWEDEEEDEEDHEVAVERLNSVTGSDGGWQSGWSMNGSNPSISQQSGRRPSEATSLARRPSVAPVPEDFGPYENAYTSGSDDIEEEPEYQNACSSSHESFRLPDNSESPAEAHDGQISPDSATSVQSDQADQSRPAPLRLNTRLSLAESALFSNPPTPFNNPASPTRTSLTNFSYPTSPIYASSDRAQSVVSRDIEHEDDAERTASIAAARKAFQEKEAAKEIKHQKNQAATEERRRRRSEAAQSMHARIWRRESTSRRPSIAMVDSAADEEADVYPPVPVSLSRKASDAVIQRKASDSRKASDAHSRKPSASGNGIFNAVDFSQNKESEAERESAFFPPYESQDSRASAYTHNPRASSHAMPAPSLPQTEPAGLWPPPAQGATYNIAGKLYDEYGMSVSQFGEEEMTPRSESSEKAKAKPKDKLIKFSAWSKTRLLRA